MVVRNPPEESIVSRPCHVVRVFTRNGTGGNHLGVVLDSSELRTVDMQLIASDLGFSETVFFEDGPAPGVRIFTPGREMPFAGHPLVGITWVLHDSGTLATDRLACGIGTVRIGYEGSGAWIEAPRDRPVRAAGGAAAVAERLGLPPPVDSAWIDMPIPYLLLQLPSPEDVAIASFSQEELDEVAVGELYLFANLEPGRMKTRFFAPEAGVFEDPATGSAAVALASMLTAGGRGSGRLEIEQGDELGHPSTIHLDWSDQGVRIGGTVVEDEVRTLDI